MQSTHLRRCVARVRRGGCIRRKPVDQSSAFRFSPETCCGSLPSVHDTLSRRALSVSITRPPRKSSVGNNRRRFIHPSQSIHPSCSASSSSNWRGVKLAPMSAAAHVQIDDDELDEAFQAELVYYGTKYIEQLDTHHHAAVASSQHEEPPEHSFAANDFDYSLESFELNEFPLHEYDPTEASTSLNPSSMTVFDSQEEEPPQSLHASENNPIDVNKLLEHFDPEKPPVTDNLEELQMWLEVEAQQEGVRKYAKTVQSARDRKDYTSLNMVQRKIVDWFPLLLSKFAQLQKAYISPDSESSSNKVNGMSKFGPYLSSVSPEKLAVIVAHETLLEVLTKREGVAFASLCSKIGNAVEEETLIQRELYKRFRERQKRQKQQNAEENVDGESDEANEISDISPEPRDEPGDKAKPSSWVYAASHLKSFFEENTKFETSVKKRSVTRKVLRRVKDTIDSAERWESKEKIRLGAVMISTLLETAQVQINGVTEDAFSHDLVPEKRSNVLKMQGLISFNPSFSKLIKDDEIKSFAAHTQRQKPMIVPPKPWSGPRDGCYLWLKSELMRAHGSKRQEEALFHSDLSTLLDGLNVLGSVPWQINKQMLEVAQRCWEDDIPLGDIPSQTDIDVPEKPIQPEYVESVPEKGTAERDAYDAEWRQFNESFSRYKRKHRQNMDLRGLRCSAILKLDQAEKFQEFDKIYFPYNVDFRGRAYPIPPHLSNVGSDLCRGMLKFAEEKPLGARGLYWLKVHLANFAGNDKITFDERAQFIDENMDKVRESASDPFGGDMWWTSLDDPFQGLATCFEIINAIDSGDPESYMCSLPVHMDGSCNGLQHYAALGRDRHGGTAVNLCATDRPQDVYSGVMEDVIKLVAEEADRILPFDASDPDSLTADEKADLRAHRAAKLINGHIDRGIVKRPVMTSVYGVTTLGAKYQVHEKLEPKLQSAGYDIDEMEAEIFQASGYLAKVILHVIREHFTGARDTMDWLTTCARLITQHGYPVAWISPLGVPSVQAYRKKKTAEIVTLCQRVTLADETSDDLPLHKSRQVSAFPPNYVHSLDSSHMMLVCPIRWTPILPFHPSVLMLTVTYFFVLFRRHSKWTEEV